MNVEEQEDLKRAMTLLFFVAGFVTLALLVGSLCGCASGADKVAAESAYTAALLRCVDAAKTVEESHACRKQVDAKFGVDGGVK